MEWMLLPYRRYFDFSGRSRRKEFWMFVLFTLLVEMVLIGLAFTLGGHTQMQDITSSGPGWSQNMRFISRLSQGAASTTMMALLGVFWLGTFVPTVAVTVRRLHDRNLSGWWYLGFAVLSVIPFLGWVADIVMLVFLCQDGTAGHNNYGADPKARGYAEVF